MVTYVPFTIVCGIRDARLYEERHRLDGIGRSANDGKQPAAPALPQLRPAPSHRSLSPHTKERDWPRQYGWRLLLTDAVIVGTACLVFGLILNADGATVAVWPDGPLLNYVGWMLGISVLWLFCLDAYETRAERHVGHGIVEYRRIVSASIAAFVVLAVVGFFLRTDMSRLLFFTVFPIGTVLLIFSRWAWRQWLRQQQEHRRFVHRTLVVGERKKTSHIVQAIMRTHGTGFDVVGAVINHGASHDRIGAVPVLGALDELTTILDAQRIDTLIVAGSDELGPKTMRTLGWQLADRDIQLVVAPALTDVAGPRVHARPVAGLPLVHVAYPTLEGSRRIAKRTFDIVGSGLLIAVFSPILLGVAIAVRVSSPGRILYRQERVGRRGKPFGMFKFRSMVQGADDQLASLLDAQGTSEKPLFKVTNDPRITPVGRVLRKYSLDELPQLFNVFIGQMSLVGPRPQRPAEVALYDDEAHRRLVVKPGMSGLWQVNGRSALSWEDALRFDLYYIENWSFTQDIVILFRTIKAVVAPENTAH